jgi:DNA invertase Pin-like site-specific DNA recombinase
MVILEELERHGISVVFIDRPPSDDPHEQLVVQIRGAVAEYERNAEFGISFVMPTPRLCRAG